MATGLHKYFVDYKTVLLVAFMFDAHDILACLSCQLQKQALMFSEIQPLMDGTIAKLNHLKTSDGQCLNEMKALLEIEGNSASIKGEKLTNFCQRADEQFKFVRVKYIEGLVKNMKLRFKKEDSCLFDYLSLLLEPVRVYDAEDNESKEALDMVTSYYGSEKQVGLVEGNMQDGYDEAVQKVDPLLDGDKLKDEWPMLKGMILGSYKDLSMEKLCKKVITLHGTLFPNFMVLCKVDLCMTVTSVECESTFSTQNRLKNKHRA